MYMHYLYFGMPMGLSAMCNLEVKQTGHAEAVHVHFRPTAKKTFMFLDVRELVVKVIHFEYKCVLQLISECIHIIRTCGHYFNQCTYYMYIRCKCTMYILNEHFICISEMYIFNVHIQCTL
jgi:hypothetical protein